MTRTTNARIAGFSTLFCWLLLRGRMIPVALAWLGILASPLLVVGLPLLLAGVLSGPVTWVMWLPMAAFEVPLGFWLLIKGVAPLRSTEVAYSRAASLRSVGRPLDR